MSDLPILRTTSQLAHHLGCSQRMARNLLKYGLIPADRTRGGHWRVKPSVRVQRALAKMKRPRDRACLHCLERQPGGIRGARRDFEFWLIMEPLENVAQRVNSDEFTQLMRRAFNAQTQGDDVLLLNSCVRWLLQHGVPPTTTSLLRRLNMSRDTLYRRFGKKMIQDALHFRLLDANSRTSRTPHE